VPPTNTPTNTPVPPTNTPTNTPVPPTNTPTNTPTATPSGTPVTGQLIVLDQASGNHLLLGSSSHVNASTVAVNGVQNTFVATLNSGSVLAANTITLEGKLLNNGGSTSGTLTQNTGTATADPLAGLPTPAVPALAPPPSHHVYQPGHYTSAVNFNGTNCLAPGIYYIDANWTVISQASLQGYNTKGCPTTSGDAGVLLYFHTGSLKVQDNAGVSGLKGMSSGPYANLVYWQDQANSATASIGANVNVSLGGAWYEPGGTLTFNDNGGTDVVSRLIVKDLTVGANDNLKVH
jgi:hypothetical protein